MANVARTVASGLLGRGPADCVIRFREYMTAIAILGRSGRMGTPLHLDGAQRCQYIGRERGPCLRVIAFFIAIARAVAFIHDAMTRISAKHTRSASHIRSRRRSPARRRGIRGLRHLRVPARREAIRHRGS
ncbi:hypothetical protein [Nitratidesulfovibrio vulgaris]|uniref:hypothetical protein n=1 Tax=Nitratidesulfovibrio vulgaris TaxID=881 RepID=UPI002301F983|nr:hypothetical protein [Nitratidesulfovibrio vulgaris]WCB47345.1 hypothetical protein PH214_04495 [Nitratidesulfovibrio vulgaris]